MPIVGVGVCGGGWVCCSRPLMPPFGGLGFGCCWVGVGWGSVPYGLVPIGMGCLVGVACGREGSCDGGLFAYGEAFVSDGVACCVPYEFVDEVLVDACRCEFVAVCGEVVSCGGLGWCFCLRVCAAELE